MPGHPADAILGGDTVAGGPPPCSPILLSRERPGITPTEYERMRVTRRSPLLGAQNTTLCAVAVEARRPAGTDADQRDCAVRRSAGSDHTTGVVTLVLLLALDHQVFGVSQITMGIEARNTERAPHSVTADAA